jgi:hypothetical protein
LCILNVTFIQLCEYIFIALGLLFQELAKMTATQTVSAAAAPSSDSQQATTSAPPPKRQCTDMTAILFGHYQKKREVRG